MLQSLKEWFKDEINTQGIKLEFLQDENTQNYKSEKLLQIFFNFLFGTFFLVFFKVSDKR